MRLIPHLSVSLFAWALGLEGPRPSVRGLSSHRSDPSLSLGFRGARWRKEALHFPDSGEHRSTEATSSTLCLGC